MTLHYKVLANRSLTHLAARQGSVHHIKKLIAQGADVVRPSLEWSEEYATVISHAAEHNSIEVVEELLQRGASLQAKDYRGFSAIHFAARAGRTKTVLYMLDRDMSLRDAVGQGYTPLHLAAWGGIEKARLFLEKGADTNAVDNNGCTPLHCAAESCSSEVLLELFIERGANVNAADNNGSTALHMAARGNNEDSLAILIEYGGDDTIANNYGETVSELLAIWRRRIEED